MKFILLLALGLIAVQANDEAIDEFIAGNARFAGNVYKELLKTNSGSFMVCPLSVQIILGLMHSGAKGNTAKQLSAGLQLPENKEKTEETFSKILPRLKGKPAYTLTCANKVYLQDNLKITEPFKNVAVNIFDSEVANIDFTKGEAAVGEINKWVEDKTQHKIKDLLKPQDVDGSTVAVLVNAMYFQGSWTHSFPEFGTQKQKFHLNSQKHVEVDMMEVTGHFYYYESTELKTKFLEMRYDGDDVSMVIALPNDIEGLSALEEHIADIVTVPKFNPERVRVQFPKFRVETTIPFIPVLQKLGIVDAFEPQADFRGIIDESVQITTVIQKTFVEVDEKGTSAAAATAVVASRSSQRDPKTPKEFIADRPFICYIKSSSGVLFIGRYTGN